MIKRMKAAETKPFKAALLEMRARLRGDVSALADEALRTSMSHDGRSTSSMPIHMADIGSDAFEQEFTLSLMASEEGTLEAVERALERIRQRTYGTCEECQGPISKMRLEAIPFAELCIRCAEANEGGTPRPTAGRRTPGRPRQPR